jgi:hypothetical protein
VNTAEFRGAATLRELSYHFAPMVHPEFTVLLARQRAGNYFAFLERSCAGGITRAFPERHEQLLADDLADVASL